LPGRTVIAVALAAVGIVVMYASDLSALSGQHGVGVAVACAIPLAAALNWSLSAKSAERGRAIDLIPAVFVGACLSSLATLPFATPFNASATDIAWLALLGVFQLAVPCMIAVWCARHMPAPELSLLCLLEILCGVAWVWLFAGERPSPQVLVGGAIVLAALAGNELITEKTSGATHV
jgi:drug/metabolite transporter (DMT)-like permease